MTRRSKTIHPLTAIIFLAYLLYYNLGFAIAPLKQESKTLVFCSEASPEGFNPMLYATTTTFDATTDTIYNRLIQFASGSTDFDLAEGLAERYEISDDQLTYTFYLRQNVAFHQNQYFQPSRFFNAEDVIFTFERQRNIDHPYHQVSNGRYLYYKRYLEPILADIKMLDEHTIVMKLNKPDQQFLSYLAMANGSIQSAEYAHLMQVKKTPEYIDQYPIGTGPFQLINYVKDNHIRYRSFTAYFAGKPFLDYLIFSITPDPAVRAAKLLRDECQIIAYPHPANLPQFQNDNHIKILEKPALSTAYLALNTQHPPLNQLKVRQALAMAINKRKIIESVYFSHAMIANNILPPSMKYYLDIEDYYHPEKAKQLLKEAELPNEFEINLWAMPVSRPYNPNAKRMAEMIQADWKAIGVNSKIISFEWAEYLKRARAGEHDAILIGWSAINTEPENFLHTLLSCQSRDEGTNYARFCDEDYEEQLNIALSHTVLSVRQKAFIALQQQLQEKMPLIPIAHTKIIQPIRNNVLNFVISPLQHHDFKKVDLKVKKPSGY